VYRTSLSSKVKRRHAQVGFQESLDGQEGLTLITCQAVPGQRAGTLRREIGNK
jgi:hypothetical protein